MSVIGIDFGNHSSFVSLVKTGGVETIDNEYSYRATPTVVSFTDLMRFTGNSAASQLVTNYRNTFSCFKNLIGLKYDDIAAQNEMKQCACMFIEIEDGRIGVEAQYLGVKRVFSIMQLVAMMLTDLKNTALRHTPKLGEIVLAVPNHFSEIQRRCFLAACSVASIEPRAIISEAAAVAYTYALFKTDLPMDNEMPRYVVFVDVGYSSTQVSVVAFNKNVIKVLVSMGSNRIGGRNFDNLLCSKFCDEFRAKYNKDVRSNRKAFNKLLNESEIMKKRTNAISSELPLRLECFMDDIDFVSKTSRDELDSLAVELYEDFTKLLNTALTKSQVEIKDIYSIEAIGGSSRITGIRRVISQVFGKEASTTLNSDEAISRGCAIQAALLSATIRIRPIKLKDVSHSEYYIVYQNKNNETKQLKIYKFGDSIPITKEVVFPPFDDFSFIINETSLSGETKKIATCRSFGKLAGDVNAEKLVFYADNSMCDIFSITRAYFFENKPVTEPAQSETDSVEKTPDAASTPTTKFVKTTHDLTFEFSYDETFHASIACYLNVEKDMIAKIEYEKERAACKNALEEYIYATRAATDTTYTGYVTSEESSTISSNLAATEDWLYAEGESTTSEVYTSKLGDLKSLVLPVQLRHECFAKLAYSLKNLSMSLLKYRKQMDIFRENAVKYPHMSMKEYNEFANKVSLMGTFSIETENLLNNHPKTKLPNISFQDVDQKHSELRSVCDRIIYMAENPPPPSKQSPPPTQSDQTTQNAPTESPNAVPMETDEAE